MLTTWAFAHGYPQVALETVEGNVASERVAQQSGFTRRDRHEDEHRGEQVVVTRWLKHPSRRDPDELDIVGTLI